MLDDQIADAQCQPVVDVAEIEERPREDAEDEGVHPCCTWGNDSGDVAVGTECALEHGVVAACRPHAEHVPRFFDCDAGGAARQEPVDDFRRLGIARVHPVHAKPRPDRREAAERLAAGEFVPTVHALGFARRQENRNVVAGFRVTGGEDLSRGGFLENPLAGLVAAAPQICGEPDPVVVHVHGERRCRRVHRQASSHLGDVIQRESHAAELLRHGHLQVAGRLQLIEIFLEEFVLAIVGGCAGPKTFEHVFGQKTDGTISHECSLRFGNRAEKGSRRIERDQRWSGAFRTGLSVVVSMRKLDGPRLAIGRSPDVAPRCPKGKNG